MIVFYLNILCSAAANPQKDIKKQQNTPLRIQGLSDIVEVACGSSFNLVRGMLHLAFIIVTKLCISGSVV